EANLARLAVEPSDVVVFAVTVAGGKIIRVAPGVAGTLGVLAAEAREIVHAEDRSGAREADEVRGPQPDAAPILRCSPGQCSVILRHDQFYIFLELTCIRFEESIKNAWLKPRNCGLCWRSHHVPACLGSFARGASARTRFSDPEHSEHRPSEIPGRV